MVSIENSMRTNTACQCDIGFVGFFSSEGFFALQSSCTVRLLILRFTFWSDTSKVNSSGAGIFQVLSLQGEAKKEESVCFYFTIIPRSETNRTMNERRSISDDLWKELPTCKPWSGILQDTRNWFVIKLQSTSRTLTTFGMDNCHTQLESCYLLGQERQPHAVV